MRKINYKAVAILIKRFAKRVALQFSHVDHARFDVALQNRLDIIGEFDKCYSIADILKLRQILSLCVSDFETADFIALLQDMNDRIDEINRVDKYIRHRKYSTSEIQSLYKTAPVAMCKVLKTFLKIHENDYSKNQQLLFANMHARRLDQLFTLNTAL